MFDMRNGRVYGRSTTGGYDMAGQTPDTGMAAGTLKRRGLIAGAAALVAGIAATRTATPVAAESADTRYFAIGSTGWGFHTGNRIPSDPQFDIGGRFQGATQGVTRSG